MNPPNTTPAQSPGHRLRGILVVFLFFPPPSTAAPIHDSSASSNWLACLTALLIFSALCLSIFKFLFVRHRKTNDLKGPPPVHVQGQHVHRVLRFLKISAYTACRNSGKCKAGFLVGFLGSPSFEARSKPSELTLIYPGADTSKSSQKHDLSNDSSLTYKTKSSDFSTGPVVLFGEKTPWKEPGQDGKHSHTSASLTKSTKSRFFLSTQLSLDLGRVRRKKRLAHAQISAPQEGLSWPHNHLEFATLRLVKLYTEPEASLPLYKDKKAVLGFAPSVSPVHNFAVAHLNRPHPLPISPLPPLPTCGPGKEMQSDVSSLDLVVDHPYGRNVLSLTRSGRQYSRRASLSPNLSIIEEICHVTPPGTPSASASVRTITSGISNGQLDMALVSEVKRSPPMSFSAYDTLKRREKLRSFSLRYKRSPPLGPSPLRSMILPEVLEGADLQSKYTTVDGLKDSPASERRSSQRRPIGLGLPTVKLSPSNEERIKPMTFISNASKENRESMMDFLRELVEETKDWDESIVLDESFRNMIQRSHDILHYTPLENVNTKCSTSKVPPGPSGRNKTPPRFVSFWLEDSPSP